MDTPEESWDASLSLADHSFFKGSIMATLKFYLCQIETRIGDYELSETIRTKTTGRIEHKIQRLCAGWYGKADKPSDPHGYSFNGGDVFVQAGPHQEVSRPLYVGLADIVTEL
jgi:hypothetical protein